MHTVGALVAAVATLLGVSTPSVATTTLVPPPIVQTVGGQQCLTLIHSLSLGDSSDDVLSLQQFLGVKQTGFFGYITKKTLTQWQLSHGVILSTDSIGAGIVGPKTRAVMHCRAVTAATSTPEAIPVVHEQQGVASTTPAVSNAPLPGGGTGTQEQTVPQCQPFDVPRPPDAQCTIGVWQIINDEAGCPVQWDCSDPNSIE